MANEEAKEAKAKPSDTVAFLAEARKRFKRCIDATSANRVFQLDDVKFAAGSPDNGWQWPEDVLAKRMKDPNGARPTLTINKLPQHIKLVTNEQRKNKPMGKILPVDDKGDAEVAEVLNGIIRHIEVSSHADVAYDTACENQVTMGEGYWRILTDYTDERSFEQDIRISGVKNSFSVSMDPDGLKRDSVGRLCEYAFVTERMPTEKYEREFPKAKGKTDWEDLGLGDDSFDWFDDEGVMIAEYFYFEREKTKIVLWSDGSVSVGDEMPKIAGLTVADTRDTELRRVRWCKINGLEVLEQSDWAGKYIPIVRVVGNEWDVEGRIVTAGIVRNAKDPMRMINYWTSQEAEMLALMPKAPFLGTPEQFENFEDDWRDANTTNFAYLKYNNVASSSGAPLPPPQRVAPPMPPMGIIEAKRGSADDLQSVMGQYNPSLGADAKEKSGRAIQARQQQADVGTYHYIDNLSRSIGYSTEIILDLIPKIYDTERVARIIGEDGEPDQCRMCVGQGQAVMERPNEVGEIEKIYDPSIGKYDVVVSVGPSFLTKRLEAAEFLTQTAQAAKDPVTAQVISWLALKSQDWPGASEAADMIKRLLPPGIVTDDEADPNDPEVQRQQIAAATQALQQKEQMMGEAHEELTQLAKDSQAKEAQAKDAEWKVRDALARVEAQSVELKAQQEVMAAERRELAIAKQLAEAQIAKAASDAQLEIQAAAVKSERETMAKREEELSIGSQLPRDVLSAMVESNAAITQAVLQMAQAITADRETVLDIDQATGEARGSRSRVVMPPTGTMQ